MQIWNKFLFKPKLIRGDGLAKIRGNLIYSLLQSNIKKAVIRIQKLASRWLKTIFTWDFRGLFLGGWGFLGWGQAQPHNCTSIRGPKTNNANLMSIDINHWIRIVNINEKAGLFRCESENIKKLPNRVLLMFLVNHPNEHVEFTDNDHWIRIWELKLWQSFLGEKIQVLKGLPYRVSFSASICPPKQLYNKLNWYGDIIRIRILSLYHLLVNPRHLHCRTGW